MGQYHRIVNLTKREFIDPHHLGCGLKLREQAKTEAGTCQALFAAVVINNGGGGGDFSEHRWIGRWKGDRIAVVGDYSDDGDLPAGDEAGDLWEACHKDQDFEPGDKCIHGSLPCFSDVSEMAAGFLESEWGFQFEGDGWRKRSDGKRPGMAPDMIISLKPKS